MRAFPSRPLARSCAAAGAFAGLVLLGSGSALAQSAACQKGGEMLNERQKLVAQLTALGNNKKKQVDPRTACGLFGKLVSNGNTVIKWLDANKEWCSIPDGFVQNIKADNAKAAEFRGQACGAAAKMAEMEKQARIQAQQAQGGGPLPGPLGGPGLTGEYKIPQGAL